MVQGGTSLVTTAPAPTIAPSPIVTPARMVALEPTDAPFRMNVGTTFQSASVCRAPAGRRRPRVHIVDKRHVMADEDVVLDRHAFADEGVGGDLAVPADEGALLDLDEGPDLGIVADRAAVEVDEGENLDVLAQLDVGRDPAVFHGISLELDSLAAVLDGLVGGLQDPDDLEPGLAVVERLLVSLEASDEIFDLGPRASVLSIFGTYMSPER